jgi:hypothetical protein
MKQLSELSEKDIAGRIEKNCGKNGTKLARLYRGRDFAKVVKRAGMPGTIMLMLIVTLAKKYQEGWMTGEVKNKFHERQKELKQASASIRESNRKVRALMPRKPNQESLELLIGMDHLAASAITKSLEIESFLKKQGQKDGVDILVRAILNRNKCFHCWEALTRVLLPADVHITACALRKRAKRYLAELGIRTETVK